MDRNPKRVLIASMLYLSIVIAGIKMFPVEKEPNFQDWDRINDCEMAVGLIADRDTDMWFEHMESCVYLDADYLNSMAEGEQQ